MFNSLSIVFVRNKRKGVNPTCWAEAITKIRHGTCTNSYRASQVRCSAGKTRDPRSGVDLPTRTNDFALAHNTNTAKGKCFAGGEAPDAGKHGSQRQFAEGRSDRQRPKGESGWQHLKQNRDMQHTYTDARLLRRACKDEYTARWK